MGDPPPMPMTKSAFTLQPTCLALMIVSTEGFSSTSANSTQDTPCLSSAAVTSAKAPHLLALFFPVTISARLPREASSALWLSIQFSSEYTRVGIKNFIRLPPPDQQFFSGTSKFLVVPNLVVCTIPLSLNPSLTRICAISSTEIAPEALTTISAPLSFV